MIARYYSQEQLNVRDDQITALVELLEATFFRF